VTTKLPDVAARPQAVPHATDRFGLDAALSEMAAVGLDEIDGIALHDRVDTKFILTEAQALEIIRALTPAYDVLEVNGLRLHPYRTLYFDTEDLALYRQHHDGIVARQKVRSREYLVSGLAFFEVKRKTGQSRTVKDRLSTERLVTAVRYEEQRFLALHPEAPGGLVPGVLSEFSRVTLVSRDGGERVTFDFSLRFAYQDRGAGLPGLVIAELKQSRVDRDSPFPREMRARRILPRAVSKYCLGVTLLLPEVKHNGFKPLLLAIGKLTRGCPDV
jgi:hypothetical protein